MDRGQSARGSLPRSNVCLYPATPPSASARSRMRPPILVVDDNVNNLRSMQALLEKVDAEIVLAQSGKDALRELLMRDFAAILLDVQMPELDGYQTAQLIRSRDRSR